MRTKKVVYISPKYEAVGSRVIRDYPADYTQNIDLLTGFTSRPAGTMAQALVSGPGLSFNYEKKKEKAAMKAFVAVDDVLVNTGSNPIRRVTLKNQENDLVLEIDYKHFPEHQAFLIEGKITNSGSVPIRHVKDLCSFDIAFDAAWTGDTVLYTIGGGTTHFVFPPFAFQIDKRRVMGSLWPSFSIDSGDTGRSSDKYMPFFYITDEDDASGVYGALEWSGIWKIDFHRRDEYLYVKGGIREVDLTIRPGETIVMPRAMLGFWEGDIHTGRNALRRFIREWYPKWQGEDLGAPVTWNHAFTFGPSITAETFKRQVPVCADLGFEWMQIDWGWYAGCIKHRKANGDAASGIGNWGRVDTERFPEGIEPLADLVRAHGMKYCTWVDPEQASPTSDFAHDHPDWLLYDDESGVRSMGLVNFGLKEVQDWFIEMITGLIRKWGVHKLKWDNNIDPINYWRKHDDPEHKGLLQLKHIRGVYRVWDELRRINPTLVLENCSSGGRRFDLGAFGHAHIHHGSDFNFHNDIVRNQISGLNTVMPSYRVIHTCTWQAHDYPDNYVQTRFGGILRFSQDFASWPQRDLDRTREHIRIYKTIRHLLKADFYALFTQPRELEAWDGWQFIDPVTQESCVMIFRLKSSEGMTCPRLRGLDPLKLYRLTNPYNGDSQTLNGQDLMADGLPIQLEPDQACILHIMPEET